MRSLASRSSLALALALALPESALAQTVANIAARRECSTAGVQALSSQLVETQICLFPGVFVRATPHANVTLSSSRLFPLMSAAGRDALWAASRSLNLQVNSMFRTLADQYVLYHSGACGLAARPGQSNHESGRAVDLANWSAALRAMTSAGCSHPYPGSDDVHFDCPGGDRRADSVRTFQRLWNTNNPGDRIDEDGAYGPITENRLGRSPAGGFSRNGCPVTPPPPPDWRAEFVAQSFPLSHVGALVMTSGELIEGWIEYRNTGARRWTASTFLATSAPRDRVSIFADGWVSPRRVVAAGDVATGATHRFPVRLRAPLMPGEYDEHFNLVQESVAWFSDPAQGGPADDLVRVRIQVRLPVTLDAGPGDAALDATRDATDGADARTDAPDARTDATSDARADAAADRPLDEGSPTDEQGCACSLVRAPTEGATRLGLLLAALALIRRRGRRIE